MLEFQSLEVGEPGWLSGVVLYNHRKALLSTLGTGEHDLLPYDTGVGRALEPDRLLVRKASREPLRRRGARLFRGSFLWSRSLYKGLFRGYMAGE
jgi:hypothetical protein